MSEKYNTNINSIEEAIKQLEDLKKDRLSFVTGDKEHDNIFLKDVQAIEIVLGNLEALADMQKSADRELENAKKINEEHRKENADLMKAINVVEKEKGEWIEDCNNLKKKVKELEEENKTEFMQGYTSCRLDFYKKYIPKKKVKDKIEEYDKKMEEEVGRPNWIVTDRIVINVLEELLEEGD